MVTGWRENDMSLNDEMLLAAMFAFVVYLLFVIIIDKYSWMIIGINISNPSRFATIPSWQWLRKSTSEREAYIEKISQCKESHNQGGHDHGEFQLRNPFLFFDWINSLWSRWTVSTAHGNLLEWILKKLNANERTQIILTRIMVPIWSLKTNPASSPANSVPARSSHKLNKSFLPFSLGWKIKEENFPYSSKCFKNLNRDHVFLAYDMTNRISPAS